MIVPALTRKLWAVPAKMHFAGPTKCIFMLPEGREQCLAGLDIAMVPTALRKLWAVRCPRRLQTCVLQAPRNAFCNLLSGSWIC